MKTIVIILFCMTFSLSAFATPKMKLGSLNPYSKKCNTETLVLYTGISFAATFLVNEYAFKTGNKKLAGLGKAMAVVSISFPVTFFIKRF